jgi:hypothetical protein
MTISPSIADLDPAHAWSQLVAMGWTIHARERNPRGYAICGACAGSPWSLDRAIAQAKKARKRK